MSEIVVKSHNSSCAPHKEIVEGMKNRFKCLRLELISLLVKCGGRGIFEDKHS